MSGDSGGAQRRPSVARPAEVDMATRAVAFVTGLLLLFGAGVFRDSTAYAALLGLVGAICVVGGIFLPFTDEIGLPGGHIKMRQRREAAAKAADPATEPEIESRIARTAGGSGFPIPDDTSVVGALNYIAGAWALEAVLERAVEGGPLARCDLRVYLYDAEMGRLRPAITTGEGAEWEPGIGATGTAYETGDYVLAVGSATSDGTYGLTAAQQATMAELEAVAATPIRSANGRIIGVLTASTSDEDHGLDSTEAKEDHDLAALLASRVLIELLQFFND